MLRRLEVAIERLVEASIASAFRLRVQPAEIGRRLERAMLDGRVASVGATLAPNRYTVRLHPEDAAVFASWEAALCQELETWLAGVAFARGLTMVASIGVRVVPDPGVRRRSVRAEACFDRGGDVSEHRPESQQNSAPPLRLLPIEPRHQEILLPSAQPTTVGRATTNHLVLPHVEVSRHHARFDPFGLGWRIIDLDSTNGTWVNGERIREAAIAVGDEVSFGGLRFTVGPE